ncbi:MAG: glycosyl hydrolase family 8 [Bacillota bacterium]|jgi:oligosaccharide reducing-end xylanase
MSKLHYHSFLGRQGRNVGGQRNQGAFAGGRYRNLLAELEYPEAEIQARLAATWDKLFYGAADTRIYYPVGTDEGYILDTGNLDVRTEGMSYGMMFCVQMDKKEEFDRIWKWTKKYMWHADGKYRGYFAWSANSDGTRRAQGPAPDGEEYFAMALFFAAHRWGDGPEPFDYSRQAKDILRACLHRGESGNGDPMWDRGNKLIKFVPESDFSDPSYHLPHFYELFSLWGDPEDSRFWAEAAQASREYLKKACHPLTGLAPEYAHFDGTPELSWGHGDFYSDAYRVAGNIALDYEWFRGDPREREEATKIQSFFARVGVADSSYPNVHDSLRQSQNYECKLPNGNFHPKYTIAGEPLAETALHPVGLLAMNALASLAAEGQNAAMFVRAFWDTPVRTGKWRYYDNCLYFFSLLGLSGNYRIW